MALATGAHNLLRVKTALHFKVDPEPFQVHSLHAPLDLSSSSVRLRPSHTNVWWAAGRGT